MNKPLGLLVQVELILETEQRHSVKSFGGWIEIVMTEGSDRLRLGRGGSLQRPLPGCWLEVITLCSGGHIPPGTYGLSSPWGAGQKRPSTSLGS